MSSAPVIARDRMTAPVLTLPKATSLAAIADAVVERNVSAIPIVDDGRLVGLVSTTDLLADLVRGDGAFVAGTAGAVMSTDVVTVPPTAPVTEIADILLRDRIHRVVVTEGEEVAGVVSASDLVVDVKARASKATLASIMMRAVATCDVGTPVDEAVRKLELAQVHGLVVVDGSRPVGVLTHREALLSRRLPATLRTQAVEDLMSYETICLDDDTPVHRAAAYASAMNVRRLLVVRKGHLVGIVSALDLAFTLRADEASPTQRDEVPVAAKVQVGG